MDCQVDQSTISAEVEVSTRDTALTPAVYSLVTETLPLPARAQMAGMVICGHIRITIQEPVIKTTGIVVGTGMHTHDKVSNTTAIEFTGKGQYIRFPYFAAVTVTNNISELLVVRFNHTGDEVPAAVDQFERWGSCLVKD